MSAITLKDFLECVDYKITDGGKYLWDCYGADAYRLDSWNSKSANAGGHTVNVVFDTVTQLVYQMEAWDDSNARVYRWVNPLYIDKFKDEHSARKILFENAYDDVNYTDIEVAEDMLEKARAISSDMPYDTRLQVELNLADADMLMLMSMAHKKDMTLNKFIEELLSKRILELQNATH